MIDVEHCFSKDVHGPHDWLDGNELLRCPGITRSRWEAR